jgi:hypothetical protein
MEQDKFYAQIVNLTRGPTNNSNGSGSDHNLLSLNTTCSQAGAPGPTAATNTTATKFLVANTPTTNRRSLFASKIEKAVNTIKNNMNSGATISTENTNSNCLYTTPSTSQGNS